MKRLVAIALSLLLLWVQAFVMAQPLAAGNSVTACCSCKRACCVTDNPSASQPQTPAAAPVSQLILNPFAFSASLAWLVPQGEAEIFSAASLSSILANRVPLFQRDCALLI
jgi:hypothetical protein